MGKSPHHTRFIKLSTAIAAFFLMFVIMANTGPLHAQSCTQFPERTTLSGTLLLYLVTDYGEGGQKIAQYQKTGEGEYVAFILKTDNKLDMAQYLDKEDVENLVEYGGETKQSVFMLVPTSNLAESFSAKDFAAQYANKRVRVTGTLFFPKAGWHYVTPVAMEYSRVGVVEPRMPKYKQKFPQKNIQVNDSVELTFSSMEEAEWKLLHRVPYEVFYDALAMVLQSDPSSIDYPFDSLTYFDPSQCAPQLTSVVWSEDRNMRCIGLTYYTPSLLVQYKADGEVRLAEDKLDDNSYWCQCPDTVYTLPTGHSTLYLVRGYDGSVGGERNYCLQAYELDKTGFHPAFVFEESNTPNPNSTRQNIYMIICNNEETTHAVSNDGLNTLVYFDGKERAVYVRVFKEKEPDADGCMFEMTNRYRKYVWDGRRFVLRP